MFIRRPKNASLLLVSLPLALTMHSVFIVAIFFWPQVNRNMLILRVINELLELDVFDGTPRSKIDIRTTSGALDGEASTKGAAVCVYLW